MSYPLDWLRRVAPIGVTLVWMSAALAAPLASSPEAPPPSPPTVTVGWSDILGAVERHPAIAGGQAAVAASRAGVRAAQTAPNPSLSASIARATPETGSSGDEWGVELSIPLGWLAARGPQVNAARAELSQSEAEAQALRREVVAQLRSLFWRVAIDQRRVEVLERLADENRTLAQAVKTRVDRGDARPVEQVLAEVELEKLEGELAAARLSLDGSREQLRAWLRLPDGAAVTVAADVDVLPPVFDRETARARAQSDPRLLVARAEVSARQAELETERLGRLPDVALQPFVSEELDVRRQGVGISTELPLWNWNRAQVAQASARLDSAKARLAAAELETETSAVESQSACEAEVTMAARYRDQVLPRTASAAATMERAWQLGEATLAEVIDARRSQLGARDQYLNNLARAQSECGRLYAAIGEEAQ